MAFMLTGQKEAPGDEGTQTRIYGVLTLVCLSVSECVCVFKPMRKKQACHHDIETSDLSNVVDAICLL